MQSVSSALDYADEKGLLDNIVVFRYFGLILIVNKKEMIRYAMQSRTSGGGGGDCGDCGTQDNLHFEAGQSPFKIKEIVYIGAGEGVGGSYSTLSISVTENAPEGLRGQEVSTSGFSIGAGVGLPVEIMAATVGRIELHRSISGSSLQELFSETNFITVKSVSALLKYTKISAYDNANKNTLLWTARLYGGGVSTAAMQGNSSTVKFK